MSKTVRNVPHWVKAVSEAELDLYDPRSRRRVERFNRRIRNKQDGAFSTELGTSDPNSPKGYNTWDPVWGMHRKRSEKALTHRTARRVAQIDDVGYEDQVDA